MGKFAQGCGQTVCVAELEPGSEAAALAPPPRRLRSVGSAGGAVSASLLAPADGKGAAQGGRWTFRINYGGGGGSGVRLVAPSDGKGAAEGGRWTVNIGSMLGGGGGAAAKGGDEVRAPAPAGGGKLNCGACQSWWDVRHHPTTSESIERNRSCHADDNNVRCSGVAQGSDVPESLVVKRLAELGVSSDSAQAATEAEEIVSPCALWRPCIVDVARPEDGRSDE